MWLVGASAAAHRLVLGQAPAECIVAAATSMAEAVVGSWLLRRFAPGDRLTRLPAALALCIAAGTAPLATVALWLPVFAWLDEPNASWQAVWRSHAAGVLAVVPLTSAWFGAWPRPNWRTARAATALAAATVTFVAFVALLLPAELATVLAVPTVLALVLVGAMRFGPRGATGTSMLAALTLATLTATGSGAFAHGPFAGTAAAQIAVLALLSVALVIAALVAERDDARARWLPGGEPGDSLLLLLPDAWYRLRTDGTFVAAEAPTGHPGPIGPTGLIGRRIQDVTPPPLGARLLREVQQAHRDEATRCVEFATAASDAEMRFVPLPDCEVLAFARDITARKRAER
jgi:integral membrane sensor domain MASE1